MQSLITIQVTQWFYLKNIKIKNDGDIKSTYIDSKIIFNCNIVPLLLGDKLILVPMIFVSKSKNKKKKQYFRT